MGFENWCKHFNGLMNDTCKAGVEYATVKDASQSPFQYPCFSDNHPVTACLLQVFPTPEEVAANEVEIRARLDRFMANVAAHVCPHCHQPIDTYRKVGRCVYVSPCGDRLWQGGLNVSMQAHNRRVKAVPE